MQRSAYFQLVANSILFSFLQFSCSQQSKSDQIRQMEESLVSSNRTINVSTQNAMKLLEGKTTDYCTKEKAVIWYSKAQFICQETKKLFDHIEMLKSNVKIEDTAMLNLFLAAKKYKEAILTIDPQIKEVFETDFQFVSNSISLLGGDTFKGYNSLSKQISSSSIRSLLISLQTEIKIAENKTVFFCDTKVGCNIMTFDSYSPFFFSKNHPPPPPARMKNPAGWGAFSKTAAQPKISINGKMIEINEDGYVLYKTQTTKKPGIYTIPINISFINPTNGKKEIVEKNIEYSIAKPCDR
ncbi:MAG: hypothetical protein IPF69_16570 [Chitinophagaceae bacterium]|nr:hypothetical protein [Chitinophagaceae bacterium]